VLTKIGIGLLAFALIAVTGAFAQEQQGGVGGTHEPTAQSSTTNESSATQDSADTSSGTAKAKRLRVGGNIAAKMIEHQVNPQYPDEAKKNHVEGTVVLRCVIATDGTVLQVEYISGPPSLMHSAMDAVRQWKYKRTMLGGKPVEVETTVAVVYSLRT
jgi:TonB family protein